MCGEVRDPGEEEGKQFGGGLWEWEWRARKGQGGFATANEGGCPQDEESCAFGGWGA